MFEIELATVLPGAKGFKEGNVNDTFRGQVLLADGAVRGAILKDLDRKQLSNEVLTSVLARTVGLPTPDVFFALVRGSDLPVTRAPHLPDGNRLVFASVDVKVPNITFRATGASVNEQQQLLRDILEWSDLGYLYAFDAWIANIDRHPGNLLFGGKNEMWLIDHGHCFSGPAWEPSDLNPDADYPNRLSEWLTGHLTLDQRRKRSSEAAKFSEVIASIDVADSRRRSGIDAILPPAYVHAVEDFLRGRTRKVPAHANRALGVPTLV
jgi:hypothetical protein